MMLHRKITVKVRSLDGDTDMLDIVAGVLHADTIASFLFIIFLDDLLEMSINLIKEKDFTLEKARM